MADGSMQGQQTGQPALPNDGGPQPPNAPVQPGSGNPVTDPATNPSAPVNAPTPTDAPVPGGEDNGMAEAMAEFNNTDAESFLHDFLNGQGIQLTDTGATAPTAPVQPQQGMASQGQPSVQPQAPGNVPQGAPNGQPPQAPTQPAQVNPAHVQALLAGQVPPAQPTAWPQAPQGMPTGQQQPQQQPQQQQAPVDPMAPPTLFDAPFQLPTELVQALNHEDPNVRATAVGAAMAAAANATVQRYHKHMMENVMPQVAQATVGQVQQLSFKETVDRELYGRNPALRYASPQLIDNAARIVVQEELARNPASANGPITPEVWAKIAALATAGLQQMAAGQPPQFQPAPMPPQYVPPQPQYAPAYQPQQYMQPAQPQMGYYPQQQPQQGGPWMTGQNGQPFGVPPMPGATPESEIASFMNGGW